MLVDFDWCDKVGEGRYPTGINQDVNWSKGVGLGKIMLKDLEMFRICRTICKYINYLQVLHIKILSLLNLIDDILT